MGKFDRVDRLMEQAGAPAAQGKESRTEVLPKEAPAPEPEAALEPRPAPGRPGALGRQLLGNLDPLVPVLGRALQAIPHGGVQAIGRGVQAAERLLPIFRMFAGGAQAAPQQAPAPEAEAQTPLAAEVLLLRERVAAQEDQLRRTRESLERTAAEQGALAHRAHQLGERSRLLTAGLLILLVMVIAQVILLAVALWR